MQYVTTTAPRKPVLVNLAWCASLLLFPVLYVASYPIAVRMTRSFHMLAYSPVEWLIDNTPLRDPTTDGQNAAVSEKRSGWPRLIVNLIDSLAVDPTHQTPVTGTLPTSGKCDWAGIGNPPTD